ncbi:MAG: hypothetical protein FJ301_14055 [Planctomycetes bacterium]|nr:hypothetical protein [Planctomycetota bacterium]
MTPTAETQKPGVIRRDAVRVVAQPAMVACGAPADGKAAHALTVVPLLDGDRIAGFEVRCGCGAATVIECVYAKES